MPRGDITDEQFARIEPLLPPLRSGNKGHPYLPHRPILNGILWVLRTGAPWQDMPARYGPYQTCFDRFVRFRRLGLWQQLLETLQAQADAAGALDWDTACIDGSVIRAHQHAAGARIDQAKAEPSDAVAPAAQSVAAPLTVPARALEPDERAAQQALGYSRGGFSTKIHLVCDGRGLPLAVTLSPGQAHESQSVEQTLDAIRVPRISRGRPRKRPRWLLGDRGYTGRPVRTTLRKRGIQSLIPTRRNEASSRKDRGPDGGRPPYFNARHYQARNVVERCFNRLKQWRRVATRYEKLAVNYLAMITLASIMLWVRSHLSDTT